MFLKTFTVSCSSHRLFLFCVICVYMSLLIFHHSWCFPHVIFSTFFHCVFFGYNFTRCTFSYQPWFVLGSCGFPSWLYLVVCLIVLCITCNFAIACLRFWCVFQDVWSATPQDTANWENHRTENKSRLVEKSATSEIITKKHTVKESAKNDEWKTPWMMEYKKRHLHTYYTK
jgi:hypothetical protein